MPPPRTPATSWFATLATAPAFLLLVVLSLPPTFGALALAMRNYTLQSPTSRWVGFNNFVRMWDDRRLFNALEVSVIWEILTVAGLHGGGGIDRHRPVRTGLATLPRCGLSRPDPADPAAARVGRLDLALHVFAADGHPQLPLHAASSAADRVPDAALSRHLRRRGGGHLAVGPVLRRHHAETAGDLAAEPASRRPGSIMPRPGASIGSSACRCCGSHSSP